MPAVFEFRHVVGPAEIDHLGHVNNLTYLRWVLNAAVAHSTAQGWPTQRYLDQGAGWVVRSHFIEYLRPAFEGQELLIRTWVSSFKRSSSIRKCQIKRPSDDALLVVAATNWVFVGFEHQVPRRIPTELSEAFELVPDDPSS